MTISLKRKGVYAVHVTERMEVFLQSLEERGFQIPARYRNQQFVWPRCTCLFAVNMNDRVLDYISEPHICAAIVSSGVKIYTVTDFLEILSKKYEKCNN